MHTLGSAHDGGAFSDEGDDAKDPSASSGPLWEDFGYEKNRRAEIPELRISAVQHNHAVSKRIGELSPQGSALEQAELRPAAAYFEGQQENSGAGGDETQAVERSTEVDPLVEPTARSVKQLEARAEQHKSPD